MMSLCMCYPPSPSLSSACAVPKSAYGHVFTGRSFGFFYRESERPRGLSGTKHIFQGSAGTQSAWDMGLNSVNVPGKSGLLSTM